MSSNHTRTLTVQRWTLSPVLLTAGLLIPIVIVVLFRTLQ